MPVKGRRPSQYVTHSQHLPDSEPDLGDSDVSQHAWHAGIGGEPDALTAHAIDLGGGSSQLTMVEIL